MTEPRVMEIDERFRLLVESVKDYAIFILTPTGHVETWNPGAARLKQYSADEIIGQHFSVFYPMSELVVANCSRALEIAQRDGHSEDEGWRIRKDGTRFWATVTITALRDDANRLIGFAKVTRDLTERKEAEERLRTLATEAAVLAEKARTHEFQERFIAILGHDLRNPLAAIDMGANLLRPPAGTDVGTDRILDRVDASVARMSRMIEQILDLTRSRLSGGMEVVPTPMDLAAMLTGVVEELRAVYPGRRVELHCPSPCPGTWDRDRLEQVFSNLIGNAIDYGFPAQAVAVFARPEGEAMVIEVHNEGIPMSDDLMTHLFDPFRRGNRDSRSPTTRGLGLGLYISREIVVAHGGDIDVESSASAGTTFRVTLPRDPSGNRMVRR